MHAPSKTSRPVAWWSFALLAAPLLAAGLFLVLVEVASMGPWPAAVLTAGVGVSASILLGRRLRMSPGAIASGLLAAAVASLPGLFVVGFAWLAVACNATDHCPIS